MPDLSQIEPHANQPAGTADTLVLDMLPTFQRCDPLQFPSEALARGQQGWVVIEAILGIDGRVEPESIRLVAVSDSIFVEAAERSLMTCHYSPGRLKGQPVRTLVRVPLVFRILKASTDTLPTSR